MAPKEKQTPAAKAAEAIESDLCSLVPDLGSERAADLLAAWTGIIAQATLDACEQAAPRVRAEERELVAQAFETEASAPEMRAHAKCLRASAAFVRALGAAT